jgi:hypothetical protein
LETFLVKVWPEWEKARKELVKTARGVAGKSAATYRLAAMEASAGPPSLLTQIIDQAKALSPDG